MSSDMKGAMGSRADDRSSMGAMGSLKRADRRFLSKAADDGHAEVALAQLAVQKAENADVRSYAQKLVTDHEGVNQELMALAQKKGVMLEAAAAAHMSAMDRSATGTGSSTGIGPRGSSTSTDAGAGNSPGAMTGGMPANGASSTTTPSGSAPAGGATSTDNMGSMGNSSSRQGSMMSNLFGSERHLRRLSKETGREFDAEFLETAVEDHKDAINLFEKAGKDSSDAEISAFANKHLPALRDHLMQAQTLAKTMK